MDIERREAILELVAGYLGVFHNARLPKGVETYGGLTIANVEPHHQGIGRIEGSDKAESWRIALDEIVSRLEISGHDMETYVCWVQDVIVPFLSHENEEKAREVQKRTIYSHNAFSRDDILDGYGRIVGGKTVWMPDAGPWDTYGDYWKARLELQMKVAEDSPVLQG
ncbi:hypothetical protein VUR80DRAFT_6523 [Thermomyces stellatus]